MTGLLFALMLERVVKESQPDGTWRVIAGPFSGNDQVEVAREVERNIESVVDIDNPGARYMIIVGPKNTEW